ncbi:hypothetical protein [Caldibacillus thermoamylovorans]|uniref:Alcohol dehydrogenase N-terminal domain-containing protein n=1 Tax=Caldibacillus thermoamylovorans TaxID=35841 RepID=A0ABD4AAR3_9BACI|nr:hypothetical protein [Caldibacillus thermoamylovorans]KIO71002.1 hypothetical protein B4166_0412 [Caldibacillus thermoamylovorans]KIO74186.1 hypothetical protein B4167_0464 [Caldibacillus thermoamylovorans]
MQSWKVTKLGEPKEVLALQEVPVPFVEPGKVLIEVEAAALNFFDILLCQGKYQEKPRFLSLRVLKFPGLSEMLGKVAMSK